MPNRTASRVEPIGIRWGIVDSVWYRGHRRHQPHDLSALLAERPAASAPAETILEIPAPENLTAAPADPPPLPPPLPGGR